MTQNILKKLMLIAVLLTGSHAFAHDFEAKNNDGVTIYYNITSTSDLTVKVTYKGSYYYSYSNEYTGSVVIPTSVTYNSKTYSVTSIGEYAFDGCSGLTSVTIPNSVTSIGSYAFFNCSSLKSVTIGNSVTSIGKSTFSNCYRLTSVTISDLEAWCKIYFEDSSSNPLYYAKNLYLNKEKVTNLVIPNTITEIKKSAFHNCSGLTSVTIPNSVTSIGEEAFKGCKCNIYVSNISLHTYENSFETCTVIVNNTIYLESNKTLPTWVDLYYSIVVSANVNSIPENKYNAIKTIWLTNTPPDGYTYISSKVHYVANDQYTSLKNVTIYPYLSSMFEVNGIKYVPVSPSERTCDAIDCAYDSTATNINILNAVSYKGVAMTLKEIKPYTCYENNYIKDICIDFNSNIPEYVFYNCSRLTNLKYNAMEIGAFAFSKCSALEQTDISATIISNNAFNLSMTEKKANIQIEAKQIQGSAFQCCSAIENAEIKVAEIGSSAFENSFTKNPATLNIESDIISDSAFNGCSAITNVTINAKQIKNYAFYNCSAIEHLTVYAEDIGNSCFSKSATKESAIFDITATNLGDNAFNGCSALQNLKVNANNIGEYAFSKSATMNMATFDVKAKTLGDSSFKGCTKVESITLSDDLTSIGNNVFENCSNLGEIVIPNTVTSMGGYSFSGCSSLKNITIGNGVKTINEYSFSGCTSLENITIGNGVKTINEYSFSSCSKLPNITIPSNVESIGDYVFNNCTSLTQVSIANRDTELSLGSNGSNPLFYSCPLDSVYIGGNITYPTTSSKGYSPFYRNTKLRSVVISDNETEISENEFYGCTNLKNISMGDDIEKIGDWAFSGCSSLDYFAFGSGMKSIGKEAFSDCTAMTKLISRTVTPPTCSTQALDDINKWVCELFVPKSAVSAYQGANQWKEFFFITGTESSGVETTFTDNVNVSVENGNIVVNGADNANIEVYSVNGQCVYNGNATTISVSAKGMYIVKVNNKSFKVIL